MSRDQARANAVDDLRRHARILDQCAAGVEQLLPPNGSTADPAGIAEDVRGIADDLREIAIGVKNDFATFAGGL